MWAYTYKLRKLPRQPNTSPKYKQKQSHLNTKLQRCWCVGIEEDLWRLVGEVERELLGQCRLAEVADDCAGVEN